MAPQSRPPERIPLFTWLMLGGSPLAKRPTYASLLRRARQRVEIEEAQTAWRAARAVAHDETTAKWGMVGPLGAWLDAVGGNHRPDDWLEWHREWKANESANGRAAREDGGEEAREGERADEEAARERQGQGKDGEREGHQASQGSKNPFRRVRFADDG